MVANVGVTLGVAVGFACGIFEYSSFFDIWILFVLFGAAQTAFALMIPPLFGKYVSGQKLFLIAILMFILMQGLFILFEFLVIQTDWVSPVEVYLSMLLYVTPVGHLLYASGDSELLMTGLNDQYKDGYVLVRFMYIVLVLLCIYLDLF